MHDDTHSTIGSNLGSTTDGGSNGGRPAGCGFSFFRGSVDALEGIDAVADATAKVSRSLADAMNASNLSFLLGAGCSSLVVDGSEIGIPTMGPLAAEFIPTEAPETDNLRLTAEDRRYLKERLGVDAATGEFEGNLERLMEVLHAYRFVLSKGQSEDTPERKAIDSIIGKVQGFILTKCLHGEFDKGNDGVLKLYESFYRKLVYRDRSLPRPWIFTTNYDLFSERALDRLGIVFANGFSGVVERYFNPAVFKYALAEQLDLSSRRWTAADNFIYLCKLHGSVNWIADSQAGIHGVREDQKPSLANAGGVMIYPTPLKHHATLASPYTDLFREFQSRIVREQSVLVMIGYSFGDEHINAIIHQALTVPTFRLVIFGDPTLSSLRRLIDLNDPRIWVIGGKTVAGKPVHYFSYIVQHFLPELPGDRIEGSVQKVVDLIRKGLQAEQRRGRGHPDSGFVMEVGDDRR